MNTEAIERKKMLNRAAKQRYLERHPDREKARRKARYAKLADNPEHKAINRARVKEYRSKKIAEDRDGFIQKERDRSRIQHPIRRKKRLEAAAGRPMPNVCDICESAAKICFDHCHASGRFRGWLCNNCNTALGLAKDSPAILRKMAAYLECQEV